MFTYSKVISAFKRQNSWTDTFRKNSKFNLPTLSSRNMRGLNHATNFRPSFHGLHKERLAQWPAFVTPKTDQKFRGGEYFQKNSVGWAARFLKPLPYFTPKSVIFPALFQTWSKVWYLISDLKPWSPASDRSAFKLLRHVHGSWRKH